MRNARCGIGEVRRSWLGWAALWLSVGCASGPSGQPATATVATSGTAGGTASASGTIGSTGTGGHASSTASASTGTSGVAASSGSTTGATSGGTSVLCGALTPGLVYWGADGHRDQGAPYSTIPLAQQIADLKGVFGDTPNTIFYRAWDEILGFQGDVPQLQDAGIVPIVSEITYPNWTSFSDEAAAYDWAYAHVITDVEAVPTAEYFIVGNEWNSQQPIAAQFAGDGSQASDWSSAPSFPIYVGAAAGAIAAIRDQAPSAKIVSGAITGWIQIAFADALADALQSYDGRDLTWDETNLHWYNDVPGASTADSAGAMGPPDDFNGGLNAYEILFGAGKPLFVDELGSSNGDDPASDSAAGANLVGLMENLVAHASATASERGVVAATVYQLYQFSTPDYFLYEIADGGTTSVLSPQGQAVKSWIGAHGNPAGGSCAGR